MNPIRQKAMITILPNLTLDDDEVRFVMSRSSGPGGQNVNKVASRVTARFDLEASPNLSGGQKARLRQRLATRINKDGVLSVSCQVHRSQSANREEALERLVELIQGALERRKPRKPTRVSRSAKARRLEEKRRQGKRKGERSRRYGPGDDG